MGMIGFTISDSDIREIYNASQEGTIGDARLRHMCRIALGERCIEVNDARHYRYPTAHEQLDAVAELTRGIVEGRLLRGKYF